LPVQYPISPITHGVAQAAVDQANALLSQNVFFSSLTKVRAWYLTPAQLVQLLTFKPVDDPSKGWMVALGIDTKKLIATMAPIAAAFNRPPAPAYYQFVDATNGEPAVAMAYPDTPGLAIDINKVAQLILASPATGHTVSIPFTHPRSSFTLKAAQALQFDTLQGTAAIDLPDESAVRLANLKAAAAKLGSVLIQPGKVLTVTNVLSPIAPVSGFQPAAGAYSRSMDIAGTNGGQDLAASALLQAAYNAGLTILARAQYPNVNTLDGPPGFDAIVQARPGGAQLDITNNTNHVMLIGVVVSQNQVKAYVFTGNAVSRSVTVSQPIVTLNQDGSIDTQVSRTVSGDISLQDQLLSHYAPVDEYP